MRVPATVRENHIVPPTQPSVPAILTPSAPLLVPESSTRDEAARCVGLHDGSVRVPEDRKESLPPKDWTVEVEPDPNAAISPSERAREKTRTSSKIGRASRRERAKISVVAESLKKKGLV